MYCRLQNAAAIIWPLSIHWHAYTGCALPTCASQGIVGDRLFVYDLATTVPMVLAAAMMWTLVGEQRLLEIQPDYAL